MASAGCEVCESDFFKYRCPSCKIRSCSLPCFKAHQAQCHDGADATAASNFGLPDGLDSTSLRSEEAAMPDTPHPNLLRREELDRLFTKHPELKSKLRAIYDATQDPGPTAEQSHNCRGWPDRGWSEEKGISRGMALLQSHLDADSRDLEDLKAFAAFIASSSG